MNVTNAQDDLVAQFPGVGTPGFIMSALRGFESLRDGVEIAMLLYRLGPAKQ